MDATTALANAKHRATLGWPLVILAIAAYAPATSTARLLLIAVGLLFLATPAGGTTRPARQPVSATPAPTGGRRTRGTDGRWTK